MPPDIDFTVFCSYITSKGVSECHFKACKSAANFLFSKGLKQLVYTGVFQPLSGFSKLAKLYQCFGDPWVPKIDPILKEVNKIVDAVYQLNVYLLLSNNYCISVFLLYRWICLFLQCSAWQTLDRSYN